MNERHTTKRLSWITAGMVAGMCLSYFWPHEPAYAITNDRDQFFAVFTCPISFGQTAQGVFVLDFQTSQLRGGIMNNKLGKFTNFFTRNLATDFQIDPAAAPHYAIVAGEANLPSVQGVTTATGVIYVAELTSGKLLAYAFPYRETARPTDFNIEPIDAFTWREAM